MWKGFVDLTTTRWPIVLINCVLSSLWWHRAIQELLTGIVFAVPNLVMERITQSTIWHVW